jgi:Uncharacterised nucleotidyltransferase
MSAALELRFPANPEFGRFGASPDFDLLLACCAHSLNAGQDDRIRRILAQDWVDWGRFAALVDHHRVVTQVYQSLSRFPYLVPSEELARLRATCNENARKALWFSCELVRIVGCLEADGIKALPYKGPVLAQRVYGDATARQFSDLDILVSPEDVLRAELALAELGYKPKVELTPRAELAYIASGYEYSFDGPHGPNLLELQWRILPRFYAVDLGTQSLFARSERMVLVGQKVTTLCADDLMLALCVHAAKHVWVQLSWLCDIAQLAKSPLAWDAIRHRAAQLGIQRIVALNFLLARELFGSPWPIEVQRWIEKDTAAELLAEEVLPILRCSAHYDTESMPYFCLMIRLRERWRDRVRFLGRLAFTPSVGEWQSIRLPEPLFPLYRLVRLGRLAKKLAA